MASSTTIDVDLDTDSKDNGMDSLEFRDLPHEKTEKGKTHEFTDFPHSALDSEEDEDDKAKLLKEEKRTATFWTFAYYQQFFDVETQQVGRRILGSMVPRPGKNYLTHIIRPNPDLYGPFWICTTLVFTTAIAGNLANYFTAAGKAYHWKYDFHKVTFAATAIFSYWWLIPLILFGLLWWRGSQTRFTFLEIICVYGYSLAIYIPISILWAVQLAWLQWTLVVVGAVLSGSVLLLTFWPAVSEDSKKIAIGMMIFIFIMHAALAAGFVLYFFYVPSSTASIPMTPTNTTAASKHDMHQPSRVAEQAEGIKTLLPTGLGGQGQDMKASRTKTESSLLNNIMTPKESDNKQGNEISPNINPNNVGPGLSQASDSEKNLPNAKNTAIKSSAISMVNIKSVERISHRNKLTKAQA